MYLEFWYTFSCALFFPRYFYYLIVVVVCWLFFLYSEIEIYQNCAHAVIHEMRHRINEFKQHLRFFRYRVQRLIKNTFVVVWFKEIFSAEKSLPINLFCHLHFSFVSHIWHLLQFRHTQMSIELKWNVKYEHRHPNNLHYFGVFIIYVEILNSLCIITRIIYVNTSSTIHKSLCAYCCSRS